jgi:TonB family protein
MCGVRTRYGGIQTRNFDGFSESKGEAVRTTAFIALLLLCPGSSWGQESRKLIKKVDPVYPDLARKMNMTGAVKVDIGIATEGSVHDVQILGGNPVLAAAVEDAVKQWNYGSGPAETKKLWNSNFSYGAKRSVVEGSRRKNGLTIE